MARPSTYLARKLVRLYSTAQRDCTVFSGIQPTGIPHLGNYLGALVNWNQKSLLKNLSEQDKVNTWKSISCLFCLVDLHAITVPQKDSKTLRTNILDSTATLIACGVDVENSILFQQSQVPEHSELAWLLSTITPVGWLKRMTQWKTKSLLLSTDENVSSDSPANANLGLLSYPVLQAADVLLYRATHAPVGDDQLQHLELARDIAKAFHGRYSSFFPYTMPLLSSCPRIMSLRDGRMKMSKSDPSDMSKLLLTDSNDLIRKKIRRSKTDLLTGIRYNVEVRPEVSNLIRIYSTLSGLEISDIESRFAGVQLEQFKDALVELVIEKVAPIRDRITLLQSDRLHLSNVLKEGSLRAREIASKNLSSIYKLVGFQ